MVFPLTLSCRLERWQPSLCATEPSTAIHPLHSSSLPDHTTYYLLLDMARRDHRGKIIRCTADTLVRAIVIGFAILVFARTAVAAWERRAPARFADYTQGSPEEPSPALPHTHFQDTGLPPAAQIASSTLSAELLIVGRCQ